MQQLTIDLGARSYPILIGRQLLERRELLEQHIAARSLLVVSNETVAKLHLAALRRGLAGFKLQTLLLPDGERYKTLETLGRILDALVEARINRDGAVIAFGGGVVGDLAGFAAACYQRGIDCVQVPTTLLAQVDSSVGGKTGVNHPGGKNLIGAFHQPRCVITDTLTLNTLPARELRAGLAEVIKCALIADASLFDWLEQHLQSLLAGDPDALEHAILRSCEIKAAIVSRDEREQGQRALLNLGHSFGHAIEAAVGYGDWLHGEAVAAGMVAAAGLSTRLGWLDPVAFERIRGLLQRASLPVAAPRIGSARALDYMRLDKKVLDDRLRLILLRGIGSALVTSDYPAADLQATLTEHFGP